MQQAILTVNCGSSSVKCAVFRANGLEAEELPILRANAINFNDRPILEISVTGSRTTRGAFEIADADPYVKCFELIFEAVDNHATDYSFVAAGHRFVHGGSQFSAPCILDDEKMELLTNLIPLAPRHQPHNIKGVSAARSKWPDIPQIACFDTAFHRTQPVTSQLYALPRELYERGVMRFGFHGLSYEYIVWRIQKLEDAGLNRRIIIAHLGAGASMCAVRDGRSLATTMGFSTLDGMPMGTRCGDIDPGVLLYLMQQEGMSVDELADVLYNQSGLLGISDISADMQALQASDDRRAQDAVSYFVEKAVRQIGSLAGALGGVDKLIFTGGIGENAADIRGRIVEASAYLGFRLDPEANAKGTGCITEPGEIPSAWVLAANEEYIIARHTLAQIGCSDC